MEILKVIKTIHYLLKILKSCKGKGESNLKVFRPLPN